MEVDRVTGRGYGGQQSYHQPLYQMVQVVPQGQGRGRGSFTHQGAGASPPGPGLPSSSGSGNQQRGSAYPLVKSSDGVSLELQGGAVEIGEAGQHEGAGIPTPPQPTPPLSQPPQQVEEEEEGHSSDSSTTMPPPPPIIK